MSDVNRSSDPNEDLADDWAAAMEEQEGGKGQARTATFDELVEDSHSGSVNMDAILDVPVTLSMEIAPASTSATCSN